MRAGWGPMALKEVGERLLTPGGFCDKEGWMQRRQRSPVGLWPFPASAETARRFAHADALPGHTIRPGTTRRRGGWNHAVT
jgi:hypothetical protein